MPLKHIWKVQAACKMPGNRKVAGSSPASGLLAYGNESSTGPLGKWSNRQSNSREVKFLSGKHEIPSETVSWLLASHPSGWLHDYIARIMLDQ